MIGERRIGLVVLCDETEVGGETGRLGSDLAAASDLLCSWRRWWRGARATARRDRGDVRIRRQLVCEIRANFPARARVVRPAGGAADVRIHQVIIREGDVRTILRVKGDLEEVAQVAVRAAAEAACTDGTPVNGMVTDLQISDHSIHRGTVSTGGLGGGANRNLGDLFQIAFDSQNRANVAFSDDHLVNTDICGTTCGPDNPSTRRKIRAYFTHQLTANPNIAPVTTGSCAGAPPPPPPGAEKITGGGQIASQTPGLTANFGFVAQNDKPNASLSYHDDGAQGGSIDVHSSNVTVPTVTFSGNCATFKGSAKVNQHPGYNYSVNACDSGEHGASKDTIFISVSAPNFSYSNGGFITSGNIQIHQQ